MLLQNKKKNPVIYGKTNPLHKSIYQSGKVNLKYCFWEVKRVKEGKMVLEGDLTWGAEHTIQCTDDVLQNWTPETYIILLTNVTPMHSIKTKKIHKKLSH